MPASAGLLDPASGGSSGRVRRDEGSGVVRAWDSFDEDRRRMIAETGAFIAWGLRHPEHVRWIPTRPDGEGDFSPRMTLVFWTPLFADYFRKPVSWLRSLLGR